MTSPCLCVSAMDSIHLSNDLVEFTFSRETGSLIQIDELRRGRKHIGRPSDGRLFRIVRPSPVWQSRYADGQDCDPPEIEAGDSNLRMHWNDLTSPDGSMDVEVRVDVDLPEGSTEAAFSMKVENLGQGPVHEVWFPWVGGWNGLAGPGEDRAHCGCVPVDPHGTFPETFTNNLGGSQSRRYYVYNYQMLLPYLDISGGGAGLSYICYQTRPALGGVVLEDLDPEPGSLSLSWSWVNQPFIAQGESWSSAPVGISIHGSDWHATADRYREFAEGWWSPPQSPPGLRTKIGFQTIQTRGFDGTPFHRFREIPDLAADGLEFGVRDLCVWDPLAGLYLRPDQGDYWEEFDPSLDLDELREALKTARDMGVNVSTLLNFRLIRGNSDLYREIGEERSMRTIFGNPYSEDWSTCSYNHASFRTKYLSRDGRVLCMRSRPQGKRCLEVVDETLDLGFTSLFLDQTFEGHPCFSEAHGHSSPDDTHEASIEWAAQASELIRKNHPEAYVIGEQAEVFAMAHININWSWNWCNLAPELLRYTLPEATLCWVVDHQLKELNRAFALGCLAALTTGQAEKSLAAYPEFASHVKKLGALRRKCAEYTVLARFMDNLGLSTKNGLAYVYQGDRGLGVVLAEIRGEGGRARLTLDTLPFGRIPEGESVIHLLNGGSRGHVPDHEGRRISLEVDLDPFDVVIWTIPCK